MMIDRPKVTSSTGRMPLPTVALQQHALQRPTDGERGGVKIRPTRNGDQPRVAAKRQNHERSEHDEVAVGDIDEAHHAERQRKAEREQRIEAAEQHALHQLG